MGKMSRYGSVEIFKRWASLYDCSSIEQCTPWRAGMNAVRERHYLKFLNPALLEVCTKTPSVNTLSCRFDALFCVVRIIAQHKLKPFSHSEQFNFRDCAKCSRRKLPYIIFVWTLSELDSVSVDSSEPHVTEIRIWRPLFPLDRLLLQLICLLETLQVDREDNWQSWVRRASPPAKSGE